jgi:ABC-type sugar transport system permease subunit
MKGKGSMEKGMLLRYKAMTIPALILLFIFTIFPIFYNVYISFTNFSLNGSTPPMSFTIASVARLRT